MLERSDMTFAAALERSIRQVLNGDHDKPGLYQAILSTNSWDDFNRTRATIIAYEIVLNMMRDVARRINEGEEPVRAPPPQQRAN
jgi:hypothetical protein